MPDFTLHSLDSAPQDARPLLENALKGFGMIPGLHAVMAEAPALLEGYQLLHGLFQNTSFNAEELTVVWQTINVEHGCHYCVPAHTGIARAMKVSDEISDALRNQTPLPDSKLEALRTFTLAMLRQRGEVDQAQLQAFYAAGYSERQVLEVILGLAQKVMSNYTNHIAQTPVDRAFAPFAWEPKAARKAS